MSTEPRPSYSLRRRLTIAMAAGFLIVLCLISIGLWAYARAAANQTYDLLLEGASIAIEERLFVVDNQVNVDLPPAAHEILALSRDDRVFYRVFHHNGETITGQSSLPQVPAFQGDGVSQFYDARYAGELVRFSTRYRTLITERSAYTIGVQLGQTRQSRNGLQWDIFAKGFVGLALLAIVSLVFSRVAINIALRPLLGVEANITKRSPSDFEPLASEPPREIESLIVAINQFMERLKISRENAEQFIADVAHQMRTSLSTVAGHFQAAEHQTDGDERERDIAKARKALHRTINLTNQLLSHAMVMHRHDDLTYEQVDMEKLIRHVMERRLSVDRDQQIDFDFEIEPSLRGDAFVLGDGVSLREAFENLVANAIQHAGGRVKIVVTLSVEQVDPELLVLRIKDNGPGMSAENKLKGMERFRAFGPNAGSGIGLSIVAAVMQNHKGRIELADSEMGGLSVTLKLPRWKGEVA